MMTIIMICLVIITAMIALPLMYYIGVLLMIGIGMVFMHYYTYLGLFFVSLSYYNDDPIWSCIGMAFFGLVSFVLYRVHKASPI